MRKILSFLIVFLGFNLSVLAENIYFNDLIYKLKVIDSDLPNIENEYFIDGESEENWTSKVEISYLSDDSKPLKYASTVDKKISTEDDKLLLKFVQNKKIDIAVLSYLENEIKSDCACFIYNVLKFEKHPDKGIMVLRFAKKYKVNTKDDIQEIANEVKSINDDYMERIIISPIPPIAKEKVLP